MGSPGLYFSLSEEDLADKSPLLGFQEAEAFALYHKALDLQKHDLFEDSARAYHELLETRLLREVSEREPLLGHRSSPWAARVSFGPLQWLRWKAAFASTGQLVATFKKRNREGVGRDPLHTWVPP